LLATARLTVGRVHADFLGHFLDPHGLLQLIDAFSREILLTGHNRVADLHDVLLAAARCS